MDVVLCAEARQELRSLPQHERAAMYAAFDTLAEIGDRLAAPHSSAIQGVEATLRELRPRAGRSPWRAFYRRIGTEIVVGAIGPEAQVDPRGFRRAVSAALGRLDAYKREDRNDGDQ
jgi:hypothetical protein